MEFLVTMTTRVPEGTSAGEVDDVRAREAAHTKELAAQGRVLRLWRPPLGPGEWRSIGLFTADGPDDLEHTLAAMPLRVWRTDEVTALASHPNDPGCDAVPVVASSQEYLVTFVVDIPVGTDQQTVDAMFAREADSARQRAAEGHLIRLWALGPGHNIGVWQAETAEQLQRILEALPMAGWLTVETVPLTRHPSDPANVGSSQQDNPAART